MSYSDFIEELSQVIGKVVSITELKKEFWFVRATLDEDKNPLSIHAFSNQQPQAKLDLLGVSGLLHSLDVSSKKKVTSYPDDQERVLLEVEQACIDLEVLNDNCYLDMDEWSIDVTMTVFKGIGGTTIEAYSPCRKVKYDAIYLKAIASEITARLNYCPENA